MYALPDPKAKKIVNKIANDKPTERMKKDFIKFLIDFNVIGYTVSFIVALSISSLLTNISKYIIIKFNIVSKGHEILLNIVNLLIVFICVYIFVQYIFYKYIYTLEVSKEIKVEKILNEKDKQDIKNDVIHNNKVQDIDEEIEDTNSTILNTIESFNNYNNYSYLN